MIILTNHEFYSRKIYYLRKLKKSIFIYPTDTIYGLGCDATDGVLINRIRELKGRATIPFSVIAPSKEWIRDVCEVSEKGEEWLSKLPGPYTLIFKLKKPEEISYSVNKGLDTLGIRIPDHWISNVVAELKIPIITTSANKSGENYMKTIDDLSTNFKNNIQYIIYEGEIKGTPSILIDLTRKEVEIKKRSL